MIFLSPPFLRLVLRLGGYSLFLIPKCLHIAWRLDGDSIVVLYSI